MDRLNSMCVFCLNVNTDSGNSPKVFTLEQNQCSGATEYAIWVFLYRQLVKAAVPGFTGEGAFKGGI